MKILIHFIFLATISFLHAELKPDMEKNPMALLPHGSVLKGVLFPRYDEQFNLVGEVKCEIMTLVDSKQVEGDKVSILFFNPDRSLCGKAFLNHALFNHQQSQLSTMEPLQISTDRLIAKGEGLTYGMQDGRGFLHGPASTRIISAPKTTSMRSRSTPTAALIALCLAPSVLIAVPPAAVSEDDLREIKTAAATTQLFSEELSTRAATSLAESVVSGEKAKNAALKLIQTSGINPAATTSTFEASTAPLSPPLSADDTVITCDGGMYFDAQQGVLVYFKNVKVTDPRFTLSGVNELKVFFDKKIANPNNNNEAVEMSGFGDIQKLVAEGAVLIDQKSLNGKDAIQASGAILTYSVPKGEIIIHGGYPWIKQGGYYACAKQPDLTLRLLESGAFSTQGSWEMGGSLKQIKK